MNDAEIERNVRRTVGLAALKRVSQLAREEQAREAAAARLARRMAWAIAFLAAVGLAWLSVRIFA